MPSARWIMLLPWLVLAACGSDQPAPDPAKIAEARRASQSITDPRMPAGFDIYAGDSGQVREFHVGEEIPGTGGKVITFSVLGQPHIIRQFYEDQAVAAGMAVTGRVNAGEFMSVDARREGDGAPRTFSASAVRKGEYANVVLQFDVTS